MYRLTYNQNAICTAALLLLAAVVTGLPAAGQDYEQEMDRIAMTLLASIENSDQTSTIAVLDFTDLSGQTTELGRFVAEELNMSLVLGRTNTNVVDRANLRSILAEHELNMSGLVEPDNAKRLGQIASVDALVLGTVTSLSDSIRLSVKVISTESALIIAAARGNVPRTQTIEQLLAIEIEGEPEAPGAGYRDSGGRADTISAQNRSNREYRNDRVRAWIRSFDKSSDDRIKMILEIYNLTEEDVSMRWRSPQVLDENGEEWDEEDRSGIEFTDWTLVSTGTFITVFFEFEAEGSSKGTTFSFLGPLTVNTGNRRLDVPVAIHGIKYDN